MNLRNSLKSAPCLLCLAVLLVLAIRAEGAQGAAPPAFTAAMAKLPDSLRQSEPLRTDLQVLFANYGSFIRGLELQPPNQVYLVMRDGQKILYDDGRAKSFEEKLKHADLEDMLSQLYKPGIPTSVTPPDDQDPGRIRVGGGF